MHFNQLPASTLIGVAASIDGLAKLLEATIEESGGFFAPEKIEGAALTGNVYYTSKGQRRADEAISSSLDVALELMRLAGVCETQYPQPAQSQRMWKRGWEIRQFKGPAGIMAIVLTAWSGPNPKLHA